MRYQKRPVCRVIALAAALLLAVVLLPVGVWSAPKQKSFTYFELFQTATEDSPADPRDINAKGIIDCGTDGG